MWKKIVWLYDRFTQRRWDKKVGWKYEFNGYEDPIEGYGLRYGL